MHATAKWPVQIPWRDEHRAQNAGGPEATRYLTKVLESDPSWSRKHQAASGLAGSGAPEARNVLHRAVEGLRARNPSRMASSVRELIQSLWQGFLEPESW